MKSKFQDIFFNNLKKYIKKNDTIYIELDLSKFGKLYKQFKSREKFLNFFFKIFVKLIGKNGNIIVPSFSYSWGKDKQIKNFDLFRSPCLTGAFPNYLLKYKNIERTIDPNFSCLVYGKDKKKFIDVSNNSFGKNSIFEKIHYKNAKLVSFATKTFDPTFVHYVEQFYNENIKKINYRYLKKIKGTITVNKLKKKKIFFSFLRNLKMKRTFCDRNIKKAMKNKKYINIVNILNNRIYICEANNFFNCGIQGMKKNSFFFTKKIN